jgi:hypothetical protein
MLCVSSRDLRFVGQLVFDVAQIDVLILALGRKPQVPARVGR